MTLAVQTHLFLARYILDPSRDSFYAVVFGLTLQETRFALGVAGGLQSDHIRLD